MKAHINEKQEPLTKILYKKRKYIKKVGFSTMAFTAKILSWLFRHLNIVGCLLKRRPTKEGSRANQDPPSPPQPFSYAPVLLKNIAHLKNPGFCAKDFCFFVVACFILFCFVCFFVQTFGRISSTQEDSLCVPSVGFCMS